MRAYLLEICHLLPFPISKYIILFFVDKPFQKRENYSKKEREIKESPST
jgi:hypothetical protein